MRVRRLVSAATVTIAVALVALAAPADAGSDITVTPTTVTAGTVVHISGASTRIGTSQCAGPVTAMLVPSPSPVGVDVAGGTPITAPDGDYMVPSVPPGKYDLLVVCGGVPTDGATLEVVPGQVVAGPRFTG